MGIITYLTTIRLGEGSLGEIGQDLADLKIARPLIVTDKGILAAGLLDKLRAAAPALASAPVFSDVPTNPTEEATLAALDLYRQEGCDGVIAFVNGMGGTPLLELYLVYGEVAALLEKAGVAVARSLVGNYITSLDMAGCSVTLLRADDELVRLWDAPVRTPGLRWGA